MGGQLRNLCSGGPFQKHMTSMQLPDEGKKARCATIIPSSINDQWYVLGNYADQHTKYTSPHWSYTAHSSQDV